MNKPDVWSKFLAGWQKRLAQDDELDRLLDDRRISLQLIQDQNIVTLTLSRQDIRFREPDGSEDFLLRIPTPAWERFFSVPPGPGYTTMQAVLLSDPTVTLAGDGRKWAQAASVIERVFHLARPSYGKDHVETPPFSGQGIAGHYIEIGADSDRHTVYYEEAGQGIPLVFLHTAGSDSRQYHYLLSHPRLQQDFHMLAFDLPYHGRSVPPDHWWEKPYLLTGHDYLKWILSFLDNTAVRPERPIILGSSMAGAITLVLAGRYGKDFRGAISCGAGFDTQGRMTPWFAHPEVNPDQYIGTWVGGLMAPQGPEYLRRLALWQYAQGGPGIYQGDIAFYSQEWPKLQKTLTRSGCPLWILIGEYDYTCSENASREVSAHMGATFQMMKGIGHFPMVENPALFLQYIFPILEQIRDNT